MQQARAQRGEAVVLYVQLAQLRVVLQAGDRFDFVLAEPQRAQSSVGLQALDHLHNGSQQEALELDK